MRAHDITAAISRVISICLVAGLSACHRNAVVLPRNAPYYEGTIRGASFATVSSAVANLTRINVWGEMRAAAGAPHGYFRIDSTTRFVVATPQGLRWEVAGAPGLMGARVRVWLQKDRPTSLTASEVWGDARLVVIDSAGSPPAGDHVSAAQPASGSEALTTRAPDFSAVDEIWRIRDILSADREPSAIDWERLRATPGYGLVHRVYDDELLDDLRIAFRPSRHAEYDSLVKSGRGRGVRVQHLVRAASLRPQLQAFRDSLARAEIIAAAVKTAARLLPPGVTDSSSPPLVAFALFADDGYSFGDSVLVDLLHAYDSDVVSFLAHEFHHTWVERIAARPAIPIDDPADRDLRIALRSLRSEGIADLIDKSYPLPSGNAATAAYALKYNEEYARTPATLRALDSLLREVAADSTRIADAGTRARSLLWSSGHATGAYMAREIRATFGVDSLYPATRDPAAFLRTFAAAESAHGRAAPFSSEAMQVVAMLEQKYWTRTTAAGCSMLVDSALANRRRSVDALAVRVPGKTPPPRPEPPRYWFYEFEVTTPATLRRDATEPMGIEGRSGPLVQFVVGPRGEVDSATVKIVGARGHDMTRQQAQELLRMWRFAPATLQGCPVPELLQLTVPAIGSSE